MPVLIIYRRRAGGVRPLALQYEVRLWLIIRNRGGWRASFDTNNSGLRPDFSVLGVIDGLE